MMNPEMMRVAEEQMRRIPADDLARMQRQLMSNPDLLKLATESMKNMTAEDFKLAAERLNHARPEEMLDMTEKIAKAKPEELAAMKVQADAEMSRAISAAKMLKRQGNQFHGRGQYADAAAKYKLARDSVKNSVPSAGGRALQLQCSVNLMACYLKLGEFEECVNEGSEVLSYDSGTAKAYYRRGQAYKELGNLQAAVADLSKAREISPDDETVAQALTEAQEKLATEGGTTNLPKGVVIEEILEEDITSHLSSAQTSSSSTAAEHTVSQPHDGARNSTQSDSSESLVNMSQVASSSSGTIPVAPNFGSNMPPGMVGMADPAMWEMFTSMMETMSPDEMANMSGLLGIEMSKEDAANAQQSMSSFSSQDLEKMMKWIGRAQRGVEAAKKTKDWLLGRKGFIFAIVMLILAFILHRLGFIG
ncbi:outer envelope protein 61-like [Triticum dicoccoides]|uniref:outer envelope protein 61-like n=1 Tax=Triticum dicoccoides TaxID=85692 RepID=UPI0018911B42|nr:outer envelope protein 61-like [Triticum dicoccoides]